MQQDICHALEAWLIMKFKHLPDKRTQIDANLSLSLKTNFHNLSLSKNPQITYVFLLKHPKKKKSNPI